GRGALLPRGRRGARGRRAALLPGVPGRPPGRGQAPHRVRVLPGGPGADRAPGAPRGAGRRGRGEDRLMGERTLVDTVAIEAVPPGTALGVEVEGTPICLVNVEGTVHAVHD